MSNLYLNEVDKMLEKAKEVTRDSHTHMEYARYADDLVILVDEFRRHEWIVGAVLKRLKEELAKIKVELNEEKSRIVDLSKGESFGFLGFEFRRVRSLRGVWRPNVTPQLKKRTALLRRINQVFRNMQTRPIQDIVSEINPILRGWVGYFCIGNSSRCFGYVREWVEKKVRRHLMRVRNRKGFGWKRWSKQWIYGSLGLFDEYKVRGHWSTAGSSH